MKPGRFNSNIALQSIDRFLTPNPTYPKIIKSVLPVGFQVQHISLKISGINLLN